MNVDLELPRSWRKFPDMPGLWELCERSLSLANAAERPAPAEWGAALEDLLDVLGATGTAARARAAQGDDRLARVMVARPAGRGPPFAGADSGDGTRRRRAAGPAPPGRSHLAVDKACSRPLGCRRVRAARCSRPGWPREQVARRTLQAWAAAHGLAVGLIRLPGRRLNGVRRLVGIAVLDLAAACLALFLVGMVVSPWIGL